MGFFKRRKPVLICQYCREDDPRRFICRDGSIVRIVPGIKIAIVMHRYFSDQFKVRYCPYCGRKF